MAKEKKLFRGRWSKGETDLLVKLFPTIDSQEVADRLGRPLTAVRQKAYEMRLKAKGFLGWSKDEVKLIKRLYPDTRAEEIAEKLGRSVLAVKGKAYRMGLKRKDWRPTVSWSTDEVRLLKKLYPHRRTQDVADQLGRSLPSVEQKAHTMRLRKTKKYLRSLGRKQ